jgi:gamma-glutamyl-gamma-aminobutyrate hydrolase PuuD
MQKNKFTLFFPSDVYSESDINFIKNLIPKDKELVIITKIKDVEDLPKIDLVYFTGGEDVSPDFYGQGVGKFTTFNKKRDDLEYSNFNNVFYGTPKLGICRGAQFLTVVNGGKLIQHVTNHNTDHNISINNSLEIPITSSHHQMMFPYDLPKEQYELIAHSTYFKSNTYLDGNNEEIKLPKGFLEPEIVYYPNSNSLCIQGHPEWMNPDCKTVTYINNLINSKLFKNEL